MPTIVTVLILGACEPPGSHTTPLPSEDVAAIEDMVESYRLAVLAREWEAVAHFYAEDGVHNAPNTAAVEASVEALEAAYTSLTAFENPIEQIDGRGDLAYARGTYSVTFSIAAPVEAMADSTAGDRTEGGGDRAANGAARLLEDTGDYLALLEKQDDSRWRITYLILNSNRPPDQMSEAPE